MKLQTYLNFNGNCRAAFAFYEKHLGGKIGMMMTHAEAPAAQLPSPDWGSAILHAQIKIGDELLLGADVPPNIHQPMRSAYLFLTVAGVEEAERVFIALSDGGQTIMPLQETFWALRFAMARDQFGTLWMINADRPVAK